MSSRSLASVFRSLDFVYLPSEDVAVEMKHYTEWLDAELPVRERDTVPRR